MPASDHIRYDREELARTFLRVGACAILTAAVMALIGAIYFGLI